MPHDITGNVPESQSGRRSCPRAATTRCRDPRTAAVPSARGARILIRMSIDSEDDRKGMRRAGRAVAAALRAMQAAARPGLTPADLDAVGAGALHAHGARSAPRMVYGVPGITF